MFDIHNNIHHIRERQTSANKHKSGNKKQKTEIRSRFNQRSISQKSHEKPQHTETNREKLEES